ncbi:MAG: hypothetical protein NTX50_30975 [Candidatus Sumerlaeota bacterium]|nr:hypothetical protein [Candidatus Sumerlaeota bacterium]
MAKDTKRNQEDEKTSVPGAAFTDFESVVKALVSLKEKGELQVFLSRYDRIRFIMDQSKWNRALAEQAVNLSTEKSNAALEEIKAILSLLSSDKTLDEIKKIILMFRYQEPEGQKTKSLSELIAKKTQLIKETLCDNSLIERSRRISTLVGRCFEDIDAELVEQRRDEVANKSVKTPFLRLRLRYSEKLPLPFFFMGPGGPPAEFDGFEIECDESDIEMMMRRLSSAKIMLLENVSKLKEGISR